MNTQFLFSFRDANANGVTLLTSLTLRYRQSHPSGEASYMGETPFPAERSANA